jgi:hypothetical protein
MSEWSGPAARNSAGREAGEPVNARIAALEAELADLRAAQQSQPPSNGTTVEQQALDARVEDAQRRAEQILAEASLAAERLRADARADVERMRAEARDEAQALLNAMGAQLADMGDAYRDAIREARKVVHLMAERVRAAQSQLPS